MAEMQYDFAGADAGPSFAELMANFLRYVAHFD